MAADGRDSLAHVHTRPPSGPVLPRRSTSCANQRWIDCRVNNTPPLSPVRETGPLRTTKEAAPHVRLSGPVTLERYRVTGEGPEFLKNRATRVL